MPHAQIPNPTGKGAESFMVAALALSPDGSTVAGAAPDFGCFFDAQTGEQRATWTEPSAFDHIVYREDGALVVVAQALALVDAQGTRSKLSRKKIFQGDAPPYEAIVAGEYLVAAHEWETKSGAFRSALMGVSLETGEMVWQAEGEVRAFVLHGGALLGAHDNELIHIDAATGDIGVVATLPVASASMWSDDSSLFLAEASGFTVHRIAPDGSVAASASMEDPIPVEGKPDPFIVEMAGFGDALVVRMRNFSPNSLGPTPWVSEDTLELLDAETLDPVEPLGFEAACKELEWSLAQPEALLTVGEDLWVGTPEGLLRFTP